MTTTCSLVGVVWPYVCMCGLQGIVSAHGWHCGTGFYCQHIAQVTITDRIIDLVNIAAI